MPFRPVINALFIVFVFACVTGCQKPVSSIRALPPTALSPDTILSAHWVGKRQLELKIDGFNFCRVWSLPETARLQSQTLDRLATNTWRLLLGDQMTAQVPATVLRPLLDDFVQEETYLEIRTSKNDQPCIVLATHFISTRYAGVWETNSAVAVGLVAGTPAIANPVAHGWVIRRTKAPLRIALTRVGEWAVIAVGPEQNTLADDIAARIQRDGIQFISAGTNLWLEASVNLPRLANCFSLSAGVNNQGQARFLEAFSGLHNAFSLSNMVFTLSGDGANVITRAKLDFIKPLSTTLEPWHLPRELLHEPLTSFTAARDVHSWLKDWPVWKNLQIGTTPDQLFAWSLAGSPFQFYLAAPLPQAGVSALADNLLQNGNPWLAAHGYINFDRSPDGNGVIWGNLPDIKPFIKSAGTGADGWVYAGLFPDTNTVAVPTTSGLIQDILPRANLVYYDWEITGPRLQPVLALAQTARLLTHRRQLVMDSAAGNWLALLVPRLGASTTFVVRTGPDELSFFRQSTLGFNAVELQLLAGWLESPDFPNGIFLSQ